MDLSNYQFRQHFPANTKGRDFIVTDLHGCYAEFDAFLTHVKFDYEVDRMFCAGDLVDRGPDSYSCALMIHQPWFFSVRGNHEQLMIDYFFGMYDDNGLWVMNGGNWAFDHPKDDMKALAKELDMLPYIITVGEGEDRFNVVHAEFTFDIDITDEKIDQLLPQEHSRWTGDPLVWGRDIIQGHPAPHDREKMSLTYCGHTPIREPVIVGKQLYMDGGAVFFHREAKSSVSRQLMMAEHKAKIMHIYNMSLGEYTEVPYSEILVADNAKQ